MSLKIPLSGHETKLQLTKKIKEMPAEREPSRQAILNFGRHRGRTFEWVWSRQTVLRVGSADSCGRGCFRVSITAEVCRTHGAVPGGIFESCEFTAQKDAQPSDETNGASASDGSTAEKQQRNRAQPEHAERRTDSSVAKECEATLHGRS